MRNRDLDRVQLHICDKIPSKKAVFAKLLQKKRAFSQQIDKYININ